MPRTSTLLIGYSFAAALTALAFAAGALDRVAAQAMVQAPKFEVDPIWPKPLPNGWLMGMAIGLAIDANDHIWVVHRPDTLSAAETAAEQNPPTGTCCRRAPPIL